MNELCPLIQTMCCLEFQIHFSEIVNYKIKYIYSQILKRNQFIIYKRVFIAASLNDCTKTRKII